MRAVARPGDSGPHASLPLRLDVWLESECSSCAAAGVAFATPMLSVRRLTSVRGSFIGRGRPATSGARTVSWAPEFGTGPLGKTTPRAAALVVVESPAKAATIQKILPADKYNVQSCVGHVRELPSSAKRIPAKYKAESWSRLGVDVENGFRPLYVLIEGKLKVINGLKAALRDADELILATDEDREGEAISWHLVELLKPKVPVRRAVFHEITPEAIAAGVADTRELDLKLVEAQETRRILDRLAGYTMSPLLWTKIARGLSAGRVQSVALSLIVKREIERLRFKQAEFHHVETKFLVSEADSSSSQASKDEGSSHQSRTIPIVATLSTLDGMRISKSTDFDPYTGSLSADAERKRIVVLNSQDAQNVLSNILSPRVTSVSKNRVLRSPPKPFVTSTLQQESGHKLGMSASRTMRVAQKLYENGYISYMRTDNPTLSEQAIKAARACVETSFGASFLADPADLKEAKKPKAAQAAHEAIRPAGTEFRSPEVLDSLESDERALYSLIYRRTLASQMAPAAFDTTALSIAVDFREGTVPLSALDGETVSSGVFRASGRVVVFAGFLQAYEEHVESGDDDASGTSQDSSTTTSARYLPEVSKGDELSVASSRSIERQTKARARFNDASLVKELEVLGVGRPSTYASIIEKLVDRTYVFRGNSLSDAKLGVSPRSLVPSLTAFAVDELLSTHFPSFVDPEFTAEMEEALDVIATGDGNGTTYLSQYYLGEDGLAAEVERTGKDIDNYAFRKLRLPNMPAEDSPRWAGVDVLVGPHGPYVEVDGIVATSLPRTTIAEELSEHRLDAVLERAKDPVIGEDPETGIPILIKTSKFGPYVQYGRDDDTPEGEKPKRQGLLPGMDVGDVDIQLALKLLSLPRRLGCHPESGKDIKANVGPFGAYVMHEKDPPVYANLRKGEHDVLEIEFETALDLLLKVEERRKKREEAALAKQEMKTETNEIEKKKSTTKKTTTSKTTASKSTGRRKLSSATSTTRRKSRTSTTKGKDAAENADVDTEDEKTTRTRRTKTPRRRSKVSAKGE